MSKICPSCGAACDDSQFFCPRCGAGLPAQQLNGQQQYGYDPSLGMKWFKFIIYFQLFATALINLLGGIAALTGGQYGGSGVAETVYLVFPGLKTVDLLYGVCLIALAAANIYVRMQLAGYRMNAPKLYLGVLAAAIAVSLIYIVAAVMMLSEWAELLDITSVIIQYIPQLIVSAVMVGVNFVYFKKREGLFNR